MKSKKYNSADVWLLFAIIYAGNENNEATLAKIIAAGDWINHAVFNADEFESGLSRLTAGKYIKEKNGNFSVTLRAERAFAKISQRGRTVEKELESLREFIGAELPTIEQPQINNLKYEGFSDERFREAVDKYLSRF